MFMTMVTNINVNYLSYQLIRQKPDRFFYQLKYLIEHPVTLIQQVAR